MVAIHPDIVALTERAAAAGLPVPTDLATEQQPVPGATVRAFHLTMRDGVRIAIDVALPPLVPGQTLPTCLRSTRYWRSKVGTPAQEHISALEVERWLREGFALVLVDARGTGASFGTWDRCWDDDQRDDLREILDWVMAQPWSDGTVGGYGTSYDGSTAHLLAATGHPAVKAVVPRFALHDGWNHIAAPGGVPLDWFTEMWATVNWTLDGHPDQATMPPVAPVVGSVKPVDDDADGTLLAQAVAEHAGNWDMWGNSRVAEVREDAGELPDMGNGTPYARIEELRKGRVPMWLWSAWYDGGYAAAQLAEFADDTLDTRVTIGPFSHGAAFPMLGDALDETARNIPPGEQISAMAGFLRAKLSGATEEVSPARLRYYRLGDGWREAASWPPAGVVNRRMHFAADGVLGGAESGERSYDIDFTASTGTATTRWHTLIGGGPIVYPDRIEQDRTLLCWDGPVLAGPLGITGTPVAHLELTATSTDFAAHVYLEAVLPQGKVLYLTEGELRASQRKPGEGETPYETFGPWHSHAAADVRPVVPGATTVLDFVLNPISILLPAGSRLRIALAGADAPLFRRIPAHGEVTLGVSSASWIDVPVEG